VKQNAILAVRAFSMADQEAFGRLSGDRNPMHLDVLRARRTQAGAPVVHGVHAAMWALEQLYLVQALPPPNSLRVRFEKFIYLDEQLSAYITYQAEERVDLELAVDGGRVASVSLGFAPPRARSSVRRGPVDQVAIEASVAELETTHGSFAFTQPDAAAAAAFPALSAAIGSQATNSLVALSTLVGMHCPGLHSIFSKIAVEFTENAHRARTLAYTVKRVQKQLRMVMIAVDGPGIFGEVESFVRQPPVDQPGCAALRQLIPAGAFLGSRVLVVGGSRGLGELTAKLTAIGGAQVVITYAVGADDAATVAENIRQAGGQCEIAKLDVMHPIDAQLAPRREPFTHLYYFATPQIFRKRSSAYSPQVLTDFLDVYVTRFFEICQSIIGDGERLRIFYPSSVAVTERPKGSAEYAMAKACGEILCDEICRSQMNIEIIVERLPRLLTDQTATVLPVENDSAVATLLPIIRKMQSS
jgi:NADP-dependent 3-hydroxy acid dehydrogenase YdfG